MRPSRRRPRSRASRTIDYDRLTLGGSAEYYVSFDNEKVGQLQGEGLQTCLGQDKKANIVFLDGSPDDSNATAFSKGAHSVLDANTNYTKVAEQAVPKWDNKQAGVIFEQMFTQQKGKIDGVLAANDGLGGAAIAILEKNGVAGKVPVTGQDATVEGLQNILAGTQCMSVYKSAKLEAGALAKLAIGLAKGEKGETTGTVQDTEGNREVPSVLLDPVAVTKDNVKDVDRRRRPEGGRRLQGLREAVHRSRDLLIPSGARRARFLSPGSRARRHTGGMHHR